MTTKLIDATALIDKLEAPWGMDPKYYTAPDNRLPESREELKASIDSAAIELLEAAPAADPADYTYNPALEQIKGDFKSHFYSEIRKLCEEIRLEKRATTAFDVGEIYGYQMAIAYIRKYFHEEESSLDSNSKS